MNMRASKPRLTVCVLTYGNHPDLARRCLESIRRHTRRDLYRLVVGANAVCPETDTYLRDLQRRGAIDRVCRSHRNINKCPMMRRLFRHVETPFLAWFDDDSYVTEPGALERLLAVAQREPARVAMWGQRAVCDHPSTFIDLEDTDTFVRTAPWYRGLTPPGWAPGGKGEFNFEGRGTGDPRWDFILGGFWLIRTRAVRALDWPDRRLRQLGDDVLLCEAIRQQGWRFSNTGTPGILFNQAERRGEPGVTQLFPTRRRRESLGTGERPRP